MKDKKFLVGAIVGIVIVGVLSFGITYYIRSKQMDEEFRQASDWANQERAREQAETVTSYKITYNGEEYTNLTQLIGVVTEPDDFTAILYFADGSTSEERKGYFSFDNIDMPEIKDTETGTLHIVLPMKYKDAISFEEFQQEVDKAQKEKEKEN